MKKLLASVLMLSLIVCSVLPVSANTVTDTIMTAGTTQAFSDQPVSEEDLTVILQAGLAAASAINQQPWYFVAVTDADIMAQLSGGSGMSGGAAPAGMPADFGGDMPEGFDASGVPADFAGGMPEGGAPAGMPAGAAPGGAAASSGAKAALGDSPAAIIIYVNQNTKSPDASFDCGLAAQNMYIAAASLGYGVKIVSSPTMTLNGADHDRLCELLGVDPSLEALAVLLIGYPDEAVDASGSATTRNELAEKVSIIK